MTATDELGKHEERVAEAQRRARTLGRDLGELNRKVAELRQKKISAHADENEAEATRLRKRIAAAEGEVTDLEERQAGAQMAASRADSERHSFVAKRYRDLISELEPAAKRAAQKIDKLSDELASAVKAWESVKSTVTGLAHVAGQAHDQHVPSLGWDDISQALRRRPKPTPLPLPAWSATATSWPSMIPIRRPARPHATRSGRRGRLSQLADEGARWSTQGGGVSFQSAAPAGIAQSP